ncbi:MAG: insulinase family protein [Muribaculaceae bacterium]|nr:insulinase family protein [Muribaculaceae bacterium]
MMIQQAIYYHTLPNGLRMVHVATTASVAWCGLAINAGSRDERDGQFGLAHFVEHTIFKGTTHRRAHNIGCRMERVGGELNAYTTKEATMLYSVFPAQHLARAVELIADLVMYSVFPADELTREMDVVLEEVASYRDTPAEAAYDDFEDIAFAGSGFGHNILGCEEHVRAFTSQHCMEYLKEQYVPSNMVFFSVGPGRPDGVFRLVEKHMGAMHHRLQRSPRLAPALQPVRHEVMTIGAHQAHTVMGARLPGLYHTSRHALMLLNNILGGPGMNALLNVEMREKRGYVYTVESSLTLFTDCGLMEIYFGCDHADVAASRRIVQRVIDKLASTPLSERALTAHKRQYCGGLLVSADSTEFVAMNAARNLLFHNHVSTVDETMERIMAVTPAQLSQAAELLAGDRLSSLTLK